jgi:hypothetical protein
MKKNQNSLFSLKSGAMLGIELVISNTGELYIDGET